MKYDVIVIGSGLAGFTAAIKCAEQGLKTAVVGNGRSALHFSSGSIELLSSTPDGQTVQFPLRAVESYPSEFPNHPFGKLGLDRVSSAMSWFGTMMAEAGLPLVGNEAGDNHLRISALGSYRSAYLSQPHVEKIPYYTEGDTFSRIVVLEVEGYRDFQANIVADNLRGQSRFSSVPVVSRSIALTESSERNSYDCRSIDLSHQLENPTMFAKFADQITRVAECTDLVVLPALFSGKAGLDLMARLKKRTALTFSEVSTMPPSLLGIRIEEALERRFTQLGGVLLRGDSVVTGMFEGERALTLEQVRTKNLEDFPLRADNYVLASGSFFSSGLTADKNSVRESIFDLDICHTGSREEWHQDRLFDARSHAFLNFGVQTDASFLPRKNGIPVQNLYCCGAVLAHYNPVAEGCGGGVAISSGHAVAQAIIHSHQASSVSEAI